MPTTSCVFQKYLSCDTCQIGLSFFLVGSITCSCTIIVASTEHHAESTWWSLSVSTVTNWVRWVGNTTFFRLRDFSINGWHTRASTMAMSYTVRTARIAIASISTYWCCRCTTASSVNNASTSTAGTIRCKGLLHNRPIWYVYGLFGFQRVRKTT